MAVKTLPASWRSAGSSSPTREMIARPRSVSTVAKRRRSSTRSRSADSLVVRASSATAMLDDDSVVIKGVIRFRFNDSRMVLKKSFVGPALAAPSLESGRMLMMVTGRLYAIDFIGVEERGAVAAILVPVASGCLEL